MGCNILRIRRTKGFTTIPDDAVRDHELSFKARGLLAYLLSMPDGWSHDGARGIAEHTKEGRDAILTGLQELEDAGYLRRPRQRDDRGQWSTEWILTDQPGPDFPASENPDIFLTEPKKKTVGRADRSKPQTVIPTDWEPTEADLAWVAEHYPSIDAWAVAREFRTYWLGRGQKMADWGMTYRNRVQKVAAFQTNGRTPARTFL
jgi:hypothetical protein